MSYLLLLVIFWKPFYYILMYLYEKYKNKNIEESNIYYNKSINWFFSLWSLVKP